MFLRPPSTADCLPVLRPAYCSPGRTDADGPDERPLMIEPICSVRHEATRQAHRHSWEAEEEVRGESRRLRIASGRQQAYVLSPGTSRKIGTIGACNGFPHVTHDSPNQPSVPPPTSRTRPPLPSPSTLFPSRPPVSMQRAIPILRLPPTGHPIAPH